jgi:hypothetical protein
MGSNPIRATDVISRRLDVCGQRPPSHPLDPLSAPRRRVERGAKDERLLEHLPIAELRDGDAVPRARLSGVDHGEEARVHVAGSRDAEQSPNGRGDPAVLLALHHHVLGLWRPISGIVGDDRVSVRSASHSLAGLRPLRDVVGMAKLALHVEILFDDRADVSLDDFAIRLVAHGTLRLPKPRPAVRGGVSMTKLVGSSGLPGGS